VGRLLIEQLTNYPAEVARAVAEHHERLDGSGYPHRLQREQVSPLGRLLAVTEGVLAALRGPQPQLARASVALRAVPGEYDLHWVGLVSYSARQQPPLQPVEGLAQIEQRLQRLDQHLQALQNQAEALLLAAASPALKDALGLVQHLLGRLRAGFNASGLWSGHAVAAQDAAEVEAVEAELRLRLQAVQRAARLQAGELAPEEQERLELLCAGLQAP